MDVIDAKCSSCQESFDSNQQIINAKGETFHLDCFVCAQCFQVFKDGLYYQFENRKYCEFDYHLLFSPTCHVCRSFINGRVIKAMNHNFHPDCFRCNSCSVLLYDSSFVKNAQKPYCKDCNTKEKLKYKTNDICVKCSIPLGDDFIRYKNELYHSYHFNCKLCSCELTREITREIKGELLCTKCQLVQLAGLAICAACHTPIEERILIAMGKNWHVDHFCCTKCEVPFNGSKHYEKKGLAYCETHFNQLFGNTCFSCNKTIAGDVFTFLNKNWCLNCFACYLCDDPMSQRTKFFHFDSKPVCSKCFDQLPSKVKLKSQDLKDSLKENKIFLLGKKSTHRT